MSNPDKRLAAIDDILQELARSEDKHDAFHSAHEGYSVLLEEVEELRDEVRKKLKDYRFDKMKEEVTQIAAMALRFRLDICDQEVK